ncbi:MULTISPECIES: BolA family transcriptional regulator [unclassified Shewanella]|jgi:BolA protein|uniref:BolA family protein n=1 Tax=unclassified Shewanella TaxID=196818 RepID=UPI000C3344A4|nr:MULTISPECIES: BolA/IbaG family iron-sulfur metabolism protein [unclassified Shewanella]MBB1363851.1 BolA/IbaG family iron-sulfur metabolism protein [Shewanella sp. SR44-4]MBO1895923.1 BolA/IbaG family iron-sulfur metabolism protein [Shewanella sp. BF02_Schw]PKH33426.1 transcriptional regulator [Shewanella sp. ALD9]QHS12544.1 BolA/IbaG family iron-sulfur metabolism protein [Shewanella sp. Arc9-LZ]
MSVEQIITDKLNHAFSPLHLEVINESNRHHVPPNSETHFKVVVVSDQFSEQRLLARHRLVNQALADELANGVHALSINAYSQPEWQALDEVPRTPNCKG